jgi:hypothetical protein
VSSKSEVIAEFTALVDAVRTYAQAAYDSSEGTARPQWFVPAGEDVDLRDPASIAAAFDRQPLHDQMLKIVGQLPDGDTVSALAPENVQPSKLTGSVADLAVIQSQLEFFQAVERAYFSATMPYCRAAAHAAARDEAHAVDGGVLDRGLVNYIANLKLAASAAGGA